MAMLLPSINDLDEVSHNLFGCNFNGVAAEHRLSIIGIVQQAQLIYAIDDLPVQVSIQVAEQIGSMKLYGKEIAEALDGIQADMSHIGEWFRISKVYHP